MHREYTESQSKSQAVAQPGKVGSREIAGRIDHTLLKPEATQSQIEQLCREAREFGFYSVCVEAKWLPVTQAALIGSEVLSITVVGFPSGVENTEQKVRETTAAVAAGAAEIDMVLNRELLRTQRYQQVVADIVAVVQAAASRPVKVILETSELKREEIAIACALSVLGGASFVKTSTGFATGGATDNDVRLMASLVAPRLGVKASGGIRDYAAAAAMIAAGATRLGTSASVAIVTAGESAEGGY